MEKAQLHIWVPADIKAGAQAYADQLGITLTAAVILLLRDALDQARQNGSS